MAVYYNEFEPFAAAWLRELIADRLIAPGDVDERSIVEVLPDDLKGYDQCHFFAGIGGWSYALRLAGWDDARPVWTGSCPCQPFSGAGKQAGYADDRHLWPEWFRLIRECRPGVVFGEQVAKAIGWGWLDLVSANLETEGYAVGSAVLPACGVGAPHKRDRLWFVGHADDTGPQGRGRQELRECAGELAVGAAGTPGPTRGVADPDGGRREPSDPSERGIPKPDPDSGGIECVADTERGTAERHGPKLGEAPSGVQGTPQQRERVRDDVRDGGNPWNDPVWLPCRDGKARPTQSGVFPLAHGIPNRVGTLRGAGNAIVPQVAAAFIQAYLATGG